MKKNYILLKAIFLFLGLSVTKLQAQVYCSAQTLYAYDDEIFNVSLGTLNNTSNCTQTGGVGSILSLYSNYTNATSPVVAAPFCIVGNNYPMSITVGQCGFGSYCGYVRVWIDYDINGTFAASEIVYTSPYTCWAISGTTMTVPGGITIPLTATPGNTRMRVIANEYNLPTNPCGSSGYYYGEVEDYNVIIGSNVPCAGTPAANTVITPTAAICPNSATGISLANTYTVGGISYQWVSSTVTAFGPWTPVSGASLSTLTTPSLTLPTYFSVVITCSTSNASVTATSGSVNVQPITLNTVPYYESFEGITANNKLPNCSWQASNIPGTCQTYTLSQTQNRNPRTGSKFAAFYYSPVADNFFFSNGIQLVAGVTYSASMWFQTEAYGYNTWDLKMYVGPNQSTVSAMEVANTNGYAASPSYKALSNTFSVTSSGVYYVGIRGTNTGQGYAYYLTWDDLAIIVPCNLNTPQLTLSPSATTICQGASVILTASGADTYLWNTGATTNTISISPNNSLMYSVVGSNASTGCSVTASQLINVNPSPVVSAAATQPTICLGKSTTLMAFGASTYTWNGTQFSANITVSPATSTVYTVNGANSFGCTSTGTIAITVSQLPNITISSGNTSGTACEGDETVLTGNGGASYQWSSNLGILLGSPVSVSPHSNTTYTLTGTDLNGCAKTATYSLNVTFCTGLKNVTSTESGISLYPNPNSGSFTIESKSNILKKFEISDITGRVIYSTSSSLEKINIDLSDYAKGVYYVKINSDNTSEVIKVVKN